MDRLRRLIGYFIGWTPTVRRPVRRRRLFGLLRRPR